MPRFHVFAGADRSNLRALMLLTALGFTITLPRAAQAQPGTVLSHQKISETYGNFTGVLDSNDRFGMTIAPLGDLNGDLIVDMAVGAALDDDGGVDCGAVWVLFLDSDGTVKGHQKICSGSGGFPGGQLDPGDKFSRLASLGDLDGDGITDLAVGAQGDDDGGSNRGAVWILFMNSDGTVASYRKISDTAGGFDGVLSDSDAFGWSVVGLRDLDRDGLPELAVGAPGDDDGGPNRGAVWILFLNSDGTVRAHQKISDAAGGFTGPLSSDDEFGHSVASLGNLDHDGTWDLAVGAFGDDDGGEGRGAVWILFLDSDGTVKAHQKISDTAGGFTGTLDDYDRFSRVTSLPDIDGDGVQELAVGAIGDDDGLGNTGALWVLFLDGNGTVKGHQKISSTQGGFTGSLNPGDQFGWSGAFLGDLDGDGRAEVAVGAYGDDDGAANCGAVWVLFLDGDVLTAAPDVVSPSGITLGVSPNPFRNQAALQYALPTVAAVRVLILDAQGRRVAKLVDRTQAAGPHSVTWLGRSDDGVPVGAGIYFARLDVAGSVAVRKVVFLR